MLVISRSILVKNVFTVQIKLSPAHCVMALFSVNNTSFPQQSGLIYGNNGSGGDEKHNNAK